MKKLTLAILLVLFGAVVGYIIVHSLLDEDFIDSIYEKDLPRAVAAFTLGLITYIHQLLMGKKRKLSFTALPSEVTKFEQYTLPWYIMIVYGTLMVYAVSGLGTLLVWTAGEITGFFFSRTIVIFNTIFVAIAFYFVGSWIGSRGDRHRWLTSVVIVFLFQGVATTVAVLLGSISISMITLTLLTTSALFLVTAIIGLWMGHRMRYPKYLHYLLEFLPHHERATVIELTYDKVQQLSSARFKTVTVTHRETLSTEVKLNDDPRTVPH
jgi:hypothetical protein